jgi:uncharacterized caspase-like protein
VLEWYGFASNHVPRLAEELLGKPQDVQHSSAGTSFPVLPIPATAEVPQSRLALRADPPIPAPTNVPPVVRGAGQLDLHLVAIGISQYAHQPLALKFAADDARAMVDLFRSRGVRYYREIHADSVLDEQATNDGILTALKKAAEASQPDDTLAVFLAGHGTMVGQRYYFIPHGFRRQAATLEDDIRQQGLPADVLADAIAKAPAKKRLLIIDTCASGGVLEISSQGRNPLAFRGAIENVGQREGVFTIAASSAGAEAQEIEALRHGVLTYALLAALKGVPPGGPLENLTLQPTSAVGMVDVLEWFSYAAGHVPRLTKQYLQQEQDVQTSGQGASFPVLPVLAQ